MSASEDLRNVCSSRGLLRLMRIYRLANLLRWLTNPLADSDLVEEVAAECAVRAWLGRQAHPWFGVAIPAGLVPLELDEQLHQWLRRNQDKRLMEYDGDRPGLGEPGSAFIEYFDQSLAMWSQANGFVPLVIQNDGHYVLEAIALPFAIRRRVRRDDPVVATADGFQGNVDGLRGAWDKAWQAAVEQKWVTEGDLLQARMLGLTPAMASLSHGDSATMPFLVAIFQHVRRLRVPPLDWVASGGMDVISGQVSDRGYLLEEWNAKERLIESLGIAKERQLLPSSNLSQKEGAGNNLSQWFRSIFGDYESHPNLEETNRELQQIDDLMSNGRPDLQVLASQLDGIRASIKKLSGLKWEACRSYAIKLRADLYCHQGSPDRCLELLPDLAATSSKQGCEALIRIAVASTDLCRHETCERLCSSALDASSSLPDVERHEVNLRGYGTRGQGRMYKALEISDQGLAESGRKDLEEALRLARELDEGESPGNWAQPRNLSYLLVWHALHHPDQAGDLYAEALKLALETNHGDGYVQRAAHLARYRALLSGGNTKLSWWPNEDPPIPDTADGWLAATALKYRGAYRAAMGDIGGAKSDFEHASEILKPVGGWLLAFIRSTVLIESAHSLRQLGSEYVEPLTQEACAILRQIHDLGEFNPQSPAAPARWIDFAKAVANPQCIILESDPRMIFAY